MSPVRLRPAQPADSPDLAALVHRGIDEGIGGRPLPGNRRATSPNLISSFILYEPVQSVALATQYGLRLAARQRRAA